MEMADAFWKMCATVVVWVMIVAILVLTSIFMLPAIGEDAMAVPIIAIIGAIVTSGFIWLGGNEDKTEKRDKDRAASEDEIYRLAENYSSKRKRDQISKNLSDLTDDELIDLRERIQMGMIDEDELAYLLQR